jgi:thiol-disulfide isomerase/thioredoxin
MKKIIDYIRDYYRKRSRVTLVFDILFYLFIILLIIPPTRREILPTLIRITAGSPSMEKKTTGKMLTDNDYYWRLETLDGSQVNLTNYRDKVIFINFWATWCPPCIAEMPSLEKLYNGYGDRLHFFFITHEEPEIVRTFLLKHKLEIPVFIQKFTAPEAIQTSSIPVTFIISSSGRVLIEKKGAARWDSRKTKRIIEEILNAEKAPTEIK